MGNSYPRPEEIFVSQPRGAREAESAAPCTTQDQIENVWATAPSQVPRASRLDLCGWQAL